MAEEGIFYVTAAMLLYPPTSEVTAASLGKLANCGGQPGWEVQVHSHCSTLQNHHKSELVLPPDLCILLILYRRSQSLNECHVALSAHGPRLQSYNKWACVQHLLAEQHGLTLTAGFNAGHEHAPADFPTLVAPHSAFLCRWPSWQVPWRSIMHPHLHRPLRAVQWQKQQQQALSR